ncbi:DUF4350 domain-containing protein [Mycobacterium sp. ITM-2016-00318]|uniref:DUF4350 domain-containing protein n=1 Tax=Mycobacterium sp. ITM-2016-00318 TaxID=2099693 RepID=UPI000CF9A8FF|nr:DUF4350 domain-containing protein [Mycobacterium sp. ITM-2016-00318]WNG92529.1 DUF4350 domain-containing protein [Mycobacterium sp. ITM-2016-00318]
MTSTATAVEPTVRQRWRTGRWVVLAIVVIGVVGTVSTLLTAPRPGGRMDPAATSSEGAHALVSMLRDRGVDVVVAEDIAAVERAARPDSLVLTVQTRDLVDDDVLHRLAAVPGDRLVMEPISRTREILAPGVRRSAGGTQGGPPDCDLREAERAGDVRFGASDTFEAVDDAPVTKCYEGAVVRYSSAGRTVTVVGSADFMANAGLLKEGNAALAMNLAGTQPRLIWYAPQHPEGDSSGAATLSDLIPPNVKWMVVQLCLVVLLLAVWKGRRLGPLVAEHLPVVVRASETVEGRGRLYRSQRASDRAADALRTATLQRLVPRLGLGPNADDAAVVAAVAQRCGRDAGAVGHLLFGPPPAGDNDLVNLANALDDIERQVAQS